MMIFLDPRAIGSSHYDHHSDSLIDGGSRLAHIRLLARTGSRNAFLNCTIQTTLATTWLIRRT